MKQWLTVIKDLCREKTGALITCVIFLLLIYGMSIFNLQAPIRQFSENENRYLAQKPEFSIGSLLKGKYTKSYEDYMTDQFVQRDSWIALKTHTERALLKKDVNGVYFAKDDYLIERHADADVDKSLEQKNVDRLVQFTKKYGKQLGAGHVKVMIVPSASEILAEKLPAFAAGYDQDNLINKIQENLDGTEGEKASDSYFVDTRPILKQHNKEYIYYRTDHHWTTLGAFYAYKEWAESMGIKAWGIDKFKVKKVSDSFYGTVFSKVNVKTRADDIYVYQPKKNMRYKLEYNTGERVTDSLYDWKKLKEKDKYSVFLGGNNALLKINTNVNNNKKLLVLKDSFSHCFLPFAVNHFEETYVLDFRYYKLGAAKFIEEHGITDILVLYNTMNFVKDRNSSSFIR